MDGTTRIHPAIALDQHHAPEAGEKAAPEQESPSGNGCVHCEHTGPRAVRDTGKQAKPATAPAAMSSGRLLVCLLVLGWSVRDLARRLDRHQTTVVRWANGLSLVPDEVAEWLEALVACHLARPAPRSAKPDVRRR